MGIFSSLKKLFFVTESVAKSAAEKSKEFVEDKAEDLADKTKEFVSDAGSTIMDKTSGLRESISDMAEKGMDKAKDLGCRICRKSQGYCGVSRRFC